ncbi:MAG TPA: hypothetical protein VFO49_03595 [Nocardioides sp.]|nr:hypothetical protein [Nocardioides sp.]
MTTLDTNSPSTAPRTAPYSSAIRKALGACLVLAGLLNGGAQYLGELLTPDHDDFGDQIAWGVDHAAIHQTEQFTLLASMLFLPLGLLGLAQVARWHAPRLTVAATLLTVWGMWGFTNVVALGYAAGSVGPDEIGVKDSVALNDAFVDHAGVMAGALYPHLIGSFLGLILLSIACWRSGVFPKAPLALLMAFLVWDFMLPSVGPLEPHLLLMVALVWLGVHLARMPARIWSGATV